MIEDKSFNFGAIINNRETIKIHFMKWVKYLLYYSLRLIFLIQFFYFNIFVNYKYFLLVYLLKYN